MKSTKYINYSYWELEQYFKKFDLIIIGSGIVGLSSAISFKKLNKKASVLVLEAGMIPSGASTKNAGFACFGSPTELLDDLKKMNEENVWNTVAMRWEGLKLLRKRLGDKNIGFQQKGGFELFDEQDEFVFCKEKIGFLNDQIKNAIGLNNTYSSAGKKSTLFKGVKGVIRNKYEGQINTGVMMNSLTRLATEKGIVILNNIHVEKINDFSQGVKLETRAGVFSASKIIVATNGFASQLLKIKDVLPARAQVLITKPIENLKIEGTYHYQQGYYYFRNIDKRILFGGGRNTDPVTETTAELGINKSIQNRLDHLLRTMILPGVKFEVEYRWSGIMGVGSEKKPIIEFVSPNVLAAVRMGGMGVAIGSLVGELAAEKINEA